MGPIIGMAVFFCTAIFISFMCSLLEAGLLSTPVSYIQSKIDSGSTVAKKFLMLKNERINDAISAILIWNTIAHTVGATGFTTCAVEYFGDKWFGVISGFITFCILLFSELIPKSIGAHYWKSIFSMTAVLVGFMIKVTYPLVISSRYVMSIFKPKNKENTVSREEVESMVNIGREEKVFTEMESDIITSLLNSRTVNVSKIMTPRSVVKTFSADTKLLDFPEDFEFSRIPIYEGNDDNIIGIAYKSKIYQDCDPENPELTIKDTDYDKKVTYVPETLKINKLFKLFLETRKHLAIVVDEYGTFVGVVTFEDVVESILNVEICDETDKIEDLQEYAKEKWSKGTGFSITV